MSTWNDYTSIAHWPNLEQHGEYLVHRYEIDGITWVRVYRGTPERAQYVARLKQGKKMLTHYLEGRRFGSLAKVFAFYDYKRRVNA